MQGHSTVSVEHWAAVTPDKPACIFPDLGMTLTFAELDRRATQAARWLIGLGLPPGATIAVLLDNRPAMFELAIAAERAGLYYAPLSTHLRSAEIGYILDDSQSRLIVTTPDLCGSLPDRAGVAVFIDAGPGTDGYDAAVASQAVASQAVASQAVASQAVGPLPSRPVGRAVLYSSGTTGRPKGIIRPMLPAEARSLPLPVSAAVAHMRADAGTIYLSAGPLYHAAPHYFSLQAMREGGTVVAPRRFDAADTLALIEQYGVTHGQWVPTMFARMLALPDAVRARHRLGSLRRAIHAAAPCPIPVKERMIAWWGPVLFEYYSGSEGVGSTGIESADWLRHKGSVGRAIGGTIHILDDAGQELPAGEVGMIWFSGLPSFDYLNAPEKTRAAVDARGWGTYGDIGHVDAEGYLYLSDRRADLILSGGVNVYPQEVETVLAGHPAVADVAVVGVPDPDLGEQVKAVVALHDGMEATAAELMAFCRARLSGVKCPRSADIVDALPRSEAGKLLRRVLKERFRGAAS